MISDSDGLRSPVDQETVRVQVPSALDLVFAHEYKILAMAQELGYDENALFRLRLGLDEALINAVRHGNEGNPELTITLEYRVTREYLVVSIADQGEGFDYCNLMDPRSEEALMRGCGRGIFLIQQFMSEVHFNEKGNCITLVFDNLVQLPLGQPGFKLWQRGDRYILEIPVLANEHVSLLLSNCFSRLQEQDGKCFIIDLSNLSQIDNGILLSLAGFSLQLKKRQGQQLLVHSSDSVQRELEVGLQGAEVCVCATLADAMRHLDQTLN
jgi:serine/threonine-protein kinase RsbW